MANEINKPIGTPVLIGIGLGVHETTVARLNEAGKPELVRNIDGEESTPSVVLIDDGGAVTVGREASKFIGTGMPGVFAEFTRDLGNPSAGGGLNRTPTPMALTTLLLRQVVQGVTESFGRLTAVTIAVPADATSHFRVAVHAAAREAGLPDVKLTDETTAAALQLTSQEELRGKYLWYRMAKSTFDAAIFESTARTVSILANFRIQRLGSKDFDQKLLNLIHQKYLRMTGDTKSAQDFQVDCSLTRLDLESARETLSTRSRTALRLVSGDHGPLKIELTQEDFGSAVRPLLEQAALAVDMALDQANLRPQELTGVFYTSDDDLGHVIQTHLASHTGQRARPTAPQVVALGAALVSAKKANPEDLNALQSISAQYLKITDIAPHYLGLIDRDWLTGTLQNRIIIRKGEPIPCARRFEVQADGTGFFPAIGLTQSGSEQTDPDFVAIIGNISSSQFRPHAKILLTIGYDVNGVAYAKRENIDEGGHQEIRVEPG
jgi:molecular chaperone DnaK